MTSTRTNCPLSRTRWPGARTGPGSRRCWPPRMSTPEEAMADLTPAQRFGQRVHAERARRGWSMRQVAIKACLPHPHAQAILRAARGDEIGLSIATRIAGALDISLDDLLRPPDTCAGRRSG